MTSRSAELDALATELRTLRSEIAAQEDELPRRAGALQHAHAASALNLLHYLALRRHDLRPLQERLARLGLSSLGRCEANVLANVDAVLEVLDGLQGRPRVPPAEPAPAIGDGDALLHRNTEALLGTARRDRRVRILVTLPSEAARNPALVRDLVAAGMDCARINCAHDDESAWARMIQHVRAADPARRTRILMDLAGPKLRTGPLLPATAVQRLRPERDRMGRVEAPAVAHLVAVGAGAAAGAVSGQTLPVPGEWLARLAPGDEVRCVDARGTRRTLVVTEVGPGTARVECDRAVYVASGNALVARRDGRPVGEAVVGELPAHTRAIRLRPGDLLELTRSLEPGFDAIRDARGNVRRPARIGCTLPEVFDQVTVGERVAFDDGRLAGVIRAVAPERLLVEIREARAKGEDLGADQGINLPDTRLALAALREKDLHDLAFVARHADAVALSFVSCPEDVAALHEQLRRLGAPPELGVVLKVETRRAFERLPDLLLAAMQSPCAGVMIARGDLAVECGWERLAEVQEEILWIAEAAHVPVIWATQVLERLAKEGRPSRAEITDAAMGERAECVMLNKGPHLPLAVRTLDDILRRMQEHQQKKRPMLRPLRVAGTLAEPRSPVGGGLTLATG